MPTLSDAYAQIFAPAQQQPYSIRDWTELYRPVGMPQYPTAPTPVGFGGLTDEERRRGTGSTLSALAQAFGAMGRGGDFATTLAQGVQGARQERQGILDEHNARQEHAYALQRQQADDAARAAALGQEDYAHKQQAQGIYGAYQSVVKLDPGMEQRAAAAARQGRTDVLDKLRGEAESNAAWAARGIDPHDKVGQMAAETQAKREAALQEKLDYEKALQEAGLGRPTAKERVQEKVDTAAALKSAGFGPQPREPKEPREPSRVVGGDGYTYEEDQRAPGGWKKISAIPPKTVTTPVEGKTVRMMPSDPKDPNSPPVPVIVDPITGTYKKATDSEVKKEIAKPAVKEEPGLLDSLTKWLHSKIPGDPANKPPPSPKPAAKVSALPGPSVATSPQGMPRGQGDIRPVAARQRGAIPWASVGRAEASQNPQVRALVESLWESGAPLAQIQMMLAEKGWGLPGRSLHQAT
jgi:hypothetical protein